MPESGEGDICIAIIEMFILCCNGGINSTVITPECGLRRFICIDGVHLDCLDHVLLETKRKHHTLARSVQRTYNVDPCRERERETRRELARE